MLRKHIYTNINPPLGNPPNNVNISDITCQDCVSYGFSMFFPLSNKLHIVGLGLTSRNETYRGRDGVAARILIAQLFVNCCATH